MLLKSEEALLCALLIEPSKLPISKAYINSSDFYHEKTKLIYEAFEYFHAQGLNADLISILDFTKDKEPKINREYINSLLNTPALVLHINTYAWNIKQASLKRQIIKSLKVGLDQIKESPDQLAEDLISNLMSSLMDINYGDKDRITLIDAADEFIKCLSQGGRKLLSTGFKELDTIIPGIPTNSLVVIGADSGVGKTVFAINMAINKAKKNEKVLIVSLEINFHDLLEILLPQLSDSEITITYQDLIKNIHTPEEIENLKNLVVSKLNGLGIYFARNCYTLEELITTIDYHKKNFGIDTAIIDHAQHITGASNYIEYTEITKSLMQYKNRQEVSLVLLSQLNDNRDKRQDKEPKKSDLRAGGNLYQDADIVIFLYKLELSSKQVYVKVDKNRKGATNDNRYLEITFEPMHRRIFLSSLAVKPIIESDEEGYTPRRERVTKAPWLKKD